MSNNYPEKRKMRKGIQQRQQHEQRGHSGIAKEEKDRTAGETFHCILFTCLWE
jgi:hypothetical protein